MGLFTADMKLHLHKTFLNQMFGTWTDSLKSLQTCAQEFDYTEDLHTLSRTRPRSLKVWLWEGSYSVTTETCRRIMKLLLQDVKFDTRNNESLLYIVGAGMERSKINPTKTDGIKISVEMIQASKRPWQ
ncbi:hypothetical protein HID58_065379, partial [Brassica napus]